MLGDKYMLRGKIVEHEGNPNFIDRVTINVDDGKQIFLDYLEEHGLTDCYFKGVRKKLVNDKGLSPDYPIDMLILRFQNSYIAGFNAIKMLFDRINWRLTGEPQNGEFKTWSYYHNDFKMIINSIPYSSNDVLDNNPWEYRNWLVWDGDGMPTFTTEPRITLSHESGSYTSRWADDIPSYSTYDLNTGNLTPSDITGVYDSGTDIS